MTLSPPVAPRDALNQTSSQEACSAQACPPQAWIPIRQLSSRFSANLDSLATRYPELAEGLRNHSPGDPHFVLAGNNGITFGVQAAGRVKPLPTVLPAAAAMDMSRQCFPKGECDRGIVVVGEDQGWLWNCLYQLPCATPQAPGHRSPLFFLMRGVDRLWLMLHVMDWAPLLADPRVRLFVGENCFSEFRASLLAAACPLPMLSVQVDPSIWPTDLTISQLAESVISEKNLRWPVLMQELQDHGNRYTPQYIARRFASGEPLKVMGITSRFTTFLQHSMRDWLTAFARLGHRTELLMESADYERTTAMFIAEACARFEPDLILMIDHYRGEIEGVPPNVPMVMWAQDLLGTLYKPQAGAAQGPSDYTIGFAYEKLRLVHQMGYPADRFLPAVIGMDPRRFAPVASDDSALAPYMCDVSLVTHASAPAERIVQKEIDTNALPEAKRLIRTLFDMLRAVYENGEAIVAPPAVRRLVDRALVDCRINPNPTLIEQLMSVFYGPVNNALFRHQTLHWLVELEIEPRLYGRGWENHPAFKQFARGVAQNQGELSLIYQASKINLHLSPMGCIHQRVMEGLASGGFFLLRRSDCDVIGRHYARLFDLCRSMGITTDQQLRDSTDSTVQETLGQVIQIHQSDPFAEKYTFMQLMQGMHDSEYICSAGCVWGSDFDQTSFASKAELSQRITHFLGQPEERTRLTRSMLQPVLERFTYDRTSSRVMEMIARDQANAVKRMAAQDS